ncbi:MAG: hypothetical protein IJ499_01100 [Clostridia bacterium]|nr:hypothetical protein [Clostridia bacterium]
MKSFLNFLGIILTAFMVICDIVEFLAVPAVFVVIGVLNSYSWQYYAIAVGGYFVLLVVVQIIMHFVFKSLDKKYTPFITRKIEKYCNRFSKKID